MADGGWYIPDLAFHPPGFVPGHAGGAPIPEEMLLRFLSAAYVGGFMDSDGCASFWQRMVVLTFSQLNYRFIQLLGHIFFGATPENFHIRGVPPANTENPGRFSRGSPECQLRFRGANAFRAAAVRIRPHVQRRFVSSLLSLRRRTLLMQSMCILDCFTSRRLFNKYVCAGAGLWRSMQTSSSSPPWRRATSMARW